MYSDSCSSKSSHLDETIPKGDAVSKVIRASKVTIEGERIELSEDKNLSDATVDAITHGYIN